MCNRRAIGFALVSLTMAFLQGCSAVGVFATGKVAKDVISDANSAGNSLIYSARNAGDALAARFGNELTVGAANATYLLGEEVDKKLSRLSTENRLVLERLDTLTQTLKDTKTGAFELKDAIALDLTTQVGDLAIWAKKDFVLQRIDGIAQMQKEGGDYTLRFTGIGFGPDSSDRSARIKQLTLAGKQFADFRENRPRAFTTEIYIPRSVLRGDEHRVSIIPVDLDVEVTSKRLLGRKPTTYPVHLQITLMPRFAGTLIVSWKQPVFDWITINPRQEYVETTGDHNQRGDIRRFPYNWPKRVDDNHRFLGPVSCPNNSHPENRNCDWSECKSVSLLENDKVLNLSIEAWGSPCTYRFWAPLQERKPTGEQSVEKPYDFVYGANLVVELPQDVTYWRLQGKTITFQPVDVVAEGTDKLLTFRDLIQSGAVQRVVYSVAVPPGVEN